MNDLGENFGEVKREIIIFIESLGINPLYPVTLILLYISFKDLNKIKKWPTLEFYEKWFTLLLWVFSISMAIMSFIYILKDIKIL